MLLCNWNYRYNTIKVERQRYNKTASLLLNSPPQSCRRGRKRNDTTYTRCKSHSSRNCRGIKKQNVNALIEFRMRGVRIKRRVLIQPLSLWEIRSYISHQGHRFITTTSTAHFFIFNSTRQSHWLKENIATRRRIIVTCEVEWKEPDPARSCEKGPGSRRDENN